MGNLCWNSRQFHRFHSRLTVLLCLVLYLKWLTRTFIKCHLSDKFIIITELNIPLLKLFPRGVFIIFKSTIRQLKIIGKYGLNSTWWYLNYVYMYIYLYTSLLKIYVAKLIISGTNNRGATKHWSNLDIIRKLPFSWIFLAIQFLFSFNLYSLHAREKERKSDRKRSFVVWEFQ